MRRRTLLAGLAALPMLSLPARADPREERAIALTRQLLSEAHVALSHGNGGPALRNVIESAFDFETWENFLLEKHADRISDAERAEFRSMLPGFMAHLYHEQFDRGLSQQPTIGTARKVRRDTLVGSRFLRPNGGELPVDWRVRDFDDGARVIDVMVAGTSFLQLKRDEFSALMDQGGANRLLDYMRQNAL